MTVMGIGELARRANVGIETVRFYEREGLLAQPDRKASGYRQYGEDTVLVLRFIRRAKELGFTLKQIRSLLDLRSDVTATRADVREKVREKVVEIDAKIADLQRMRTGLHALADRCHGDGAAQNCPILGALQGANFDQVTSHDDE
jgi:MerR family copper efflux transcriptional regulator